MGWADNLIDLAVGGLPGAARALLPPHIVRQWRERLDDYNPLKTISANHDLVRATRLAWIEAAQEIFKEARRSAARDEFRSQANDITRFDDHVTECLLDLRDAALDRRKDPGVSPIDGHLDAIINGVPELVSPGEHPGIGRSVTSSFVQILSQLSDWEAQEIPSVYAQIAVTGLATHGGGRARAFGELVFASFAETIKDPGKYPQAREAFSIAMDKLARGIGQSTLEAVRGLDGRLDAVMAGLDGLDILRNGAIRYLEFLPVIASDAAATRINTEEILRIVSQREGVPLETLRAILKEMGEASDRFDAGQIEATLKTKAAEFRSLTELLHRLSNTDPEVVRLRQAAAEALSKGRFTEAGAHFASAAARSLSGLEEIEGSARHKRLSTAEIYAESAAAARLRPNPEGYREAAGHYGEAARIAATADAGLARAYLIRQGQTLQDLGNEFGRNTALMDAIEHFRAMLKNENRRLESLDWAATQNDLGTALRTLGEREGGTARLEEAVTAFRAALEERTRERVPLDWATTQNNLGIALWVLGQRESGTARLEEAATAFRDALEERTRERAPLAWATTQGNLGNARQTLGERESGTARLEEAVTAYRVVLEEYTRERVPLDWAMTQNNLGNALQTLGERESGTARLEEAITAYRAALEERTRERVPLDWAMTQNNLGNALQTLGERESDTARLEQAVTAYRAALEEYTRERVPLAWAMTQNNLGSALRTLGQRESGTARLEEAVAAYRDALEERTRERVPLAWAATQYNLGNALRALGERESGTTRLEEAVTAYRAALEEETRERVPLAWAATQEALEKAIAEVAKRTAP